MPLLDLTVADEDATARLAEDLAAILAPGDVVALSGDLGAGKSAFARALIRALADDPDLEVPSPTFTLVQPYEAGGLKVAHMDLYRLSDPSELDEIGFDAAVAEGAVLVEWPDRAGDRLPADALSVSIEDRGGTARRFVLATGAPARWEARIGRSRAIRGLLEADGAPPAARRRMAGDASARRFERVRRGGERLVAMDWPRRPPQPVLRDGLSYPALVHVTDDPLAFAGVALLLRQAGFRAPGLIALDREAGLLLVEDLGATGILEAGRPVPERALAAVEVLAEKDGTAFPDRIAVPGVGTHVLPPFDPRALAVELSLLPDWYLPLVAGRPADPAVAADFEAAWAPFVARLDALPKGLVLRDVIAANLTVDLAAAGRDRIGFLDLQDAMTGPAPYDLASFLDDVRFDWPAPLRAALLARYLEVRRSLDPGFDAETFEAGLALATAQRASKILGGFARLASRDGKRGYLAHLPRTRARLAGALSHPLLAPLRLWYERHGVLDA